MPEGRVLFPSGVPACGAPYSLPCRRLLPTSYTAVEAAFRLPWNNGIVEGHVNRLKFLKRRMFGRAHLDLLRVKVLHAV
jgi:transposase